MVDDSFSAIYLQNQECTGLRVFIMRTLALYKIISRCAHRYQLHVAGMRTGMHCPEHVREDKESGQNLYADSLVSREYQIRNHSQQDAGIESEKTLVAYGSVTDNTSSVTNEMRDAAAGHSAATIAQIGNVFNATSFIKVGKETMLIWNSM